MMKKTFRKVVNFLSKERDAFKLALLIKEVDHDRFHDYEQILKQQLLYLRVHREEYPSCDIDVWFWMEVAKRVLDKTEILREIVGYQPMSGTVDIVGHLRYHGNLLDGSITLSYEKARHEASTRKLATRAPVGPLSDCKPMFGISLQSELIALLSSEIASEIIDHIIINLSKLATPFRPEEGPVSLVELDSGKHKCPRCAFTLNSARNKIAHTTRRGSGNFIIASIEDANKLKQLPYFRLVILAAWDR
jgi:hypothetical protein